MRRFGIVFAFIACWSATVFAMQTQKQRIGEIRGGESIDRLHTKASISGGKPTYIVALSLSNTCTRILTPAGSDSYRSVYGLAADPDIRHYGYMVRDTADRLLLIENGKPVRDFGDGFVYFDKSVLNRAVFSADFSKWIMLACRQDWLTIVWTDKGMLGTVRAFAAFSDGQIIHASHDLSRLAWIAENDSKQTLTVDGKQAFIAKSFGDFEWSADASRWAVTARVDDGAALVIDGKTVAELPDVRRIAGSVLKSDFSDFLMTYCDADGVWKVRSRSFVKSLPKDWAIVSEFAASADLSDRLFIAKTKKGEWTVRWRDFDFGPYRELYKIRVGSGENILQTLGQLREWMVCGKRTDGRIEVVITGRRAVVIDDCSEIAAFCADESLQRWSVIVRDDKDTAKLITCGKTLETFGLSSRLIDADITVTPDEKRWSIRFRDASGWFYYIDKRLYGPYEDGSQVLYSQDGRHWGFTADAVTVIDAVAVSGDSAGLSLKPSTSGQVFVWISAEAGELFFNTMEINK